VPPPLRRVPSPRQIPGYAYGEVGRQIRRRTAIQRSVGQHSDFKENALRNTKPMETGERIRDNVLSGGFQRSAVLQRFEPTGVAGSGWQVVQSTRR